MPAHHPLDRLACADRLKPWRVPQAGGKKPFDLARMDPDAKPFNVGVKAENKDSIQALAMEIDTLQNLFYADRRYKLLVVLQGTDTSGKDGTVRWVFGRTSPLGVRTAGWKAPSELERDHDYLWRIHQKVPGAGEIMVFNRSHYEDVLVPGVNGWITPEQVRQRYAHINDFERLLSETGTVILKFMLHIGFDEQRERLQARLDDPTKFWKFCASDITAREQWPQYQAAYQDALAATSTPWAPWIVVPANSKTHRNLMVATVIRDTLSALDLRHPPGDPALQNYRVQ